MKKLTVLGVSVLAGCTLMLAPACGSNSSSSNVALASKHHDHFSNSDFAMMAYLKYTKQQINNVNDGSVQLNHQGHNYVLSDGNNQFKIAVNHNKVSVQSSNQGQNSQKRTYTKSQLSKQFKGQKGAIKNKLAPTNDQANNGNNNQQQTDNNNQQSQANNQQAAGQADGNNQGAPVHMSENDWYKAMLAAGWNEDHDTEAYYAQKAGLQGADVEP